MAATHRLRKILLPILILAAGVLVMRALIVSRRPPAKEAQAKVGVLVEVMPAVKVDQRVVVRGTGTVQAARETGVVMQVGGRINEMAPGFAAGAFFKAGELLFAVEAVDYELAVARAQAAVARAASNLDTTKARSRVAALEWERQHPGESPDSLVVFRPQVQEAEAGLEAARADLRQARLNLHRTRVVAPFNCRVRAEQVEIGQFVGIGANVATLAGTDLAEIVVPLPIDELRWLRIPTGKAARGPAASATVRMTDGAQTHEWQGQVVRSLGEVDAKGRMVRVVVQVADPYNFQDAKERTGPALIPGMFVDVLLHGAEVAGVYALSPAALRDDSTVWLMDGERKLRVQPVHLARLQEGMAWIDSGLQDGDQVVVTALPGGAEGMQLRLAQGEESR